MELDLVTDAVVHVHSDVAGAPLITPDGSMVLTLNARAGKVCAAGVQ